MKKSLNVVIDEKVRERLLKMSEKHKISQGAIVEAAIIPVLDKLEREEPLL